MQGDDTTDVTILLGKVRAGETGALERLLSLLYDELRALARRQRRRTSNETINTTALVHEAYEKLARQDGGWADRGHFFRVAAKAMRDILVDYARQRRAAKRGGAQPHVPIEDLSLFADERTDEVIALDEALTRLAALDARQGEVVELRYFVGLSIPETADVLGLSPSTVKREWTAARAWLQREMTRKA